MKKIIKLKAGDLVPDDAKFLGEFRDVSHWVADEPQEFMPGKLQALYAPFFFYEITVQDKIQEKTITISESQFNEAAEEVLNIIQGDFKTFLNPQFRDTVKVLLKKRLGF